MLSKEERQVLLNSAGMIYTKYIALDVMRNKVFCKTQNESANMSSLYDMCIQYIASADTHKEILIGEKVYNLVKQPGSNNITITRPYLDSPVIKQLDKYSDTDLTTLLYDQTFTFQQISNGDWASGILLPDNTVLGGPNKIAIYRTHLVTLYNIIQRINQNQTIDLKAMLVAFPTGSGKTFFQALWLHVLSFAGVTAIFTMPENLVPQFCKDMGRMLPDSVVANINVLKGDANELTAIISQGSKIIVTSSKNLLDNCFHADILCNNKSIFLSFDEQHKTDEVERHSVRRTILEEKHVSLYLTATPREKTYIESGKKPVAMMSPAQKQQAGQGKLGSIKTIQTMFDVDLNRKYVPLKHYKKFILNEIFSLGAGWFFSPISSAAREAIEYLPYQISYEPGKNKRWDIQMPMATKMLWLIDDNESLVNFFQRVNSGNRAYYYHDGALQTVNEAKLYVNDYIKDMKKSLDTMHKKNFFDAQTKGMSDNCKCKYKKIADGGLFRQVRANMFHYLIEYVLMDITGLMQIELNELRKNDLSTLVAKVQSYYDNEEPQDRDYFFEKLVGKIGQEAADEISPLLGNIASYLKFLSNNSSDILKDFCDNSFVDSRLYEVLIDKIGSFKIAFANYANKYQIVAVMANMKESETSIEDSKPFNAMQHVEHVTSNDETNVRKVKKRRRSAMEQLAEVFGKKVSDDYFDPQYLENVDEQLIDKLFDLGFVGIYVSNKKSVGANFRDLHTVVSIVENDLTENANPNVQVQSYGRLRGLDSTMSPTYISVLGRKVKTLFDLNLLAQDGDYYPKYFEAEKAYNKKCIKTLGKSLAQDIIKAYNESHDKSGETNYPLYKSKTLKLIAKAFRQLNINNHFDASLSRAQLSEVITIASSHIDDEIYTIKHPYDIGLFPRFAVGFINGLFSIYCAPHNFYINRNLAKHAASLKTTDPTKNADRIYLKIIKSNITLGNFQGAGLTMMEFFGWALRVKDNLLANQSLDVIKKLSAIFSEYQNTRDLQKSIFALISLIPEILRNFESILRLVFKYFSPILFHPEMLKNIDMLFADLTKEDLIYLLTLDNDGKLSKEDASNSVDILFNLIEKIRKHDTEGLIVEIKCICFNILFPVLAELFVPLVEVFSHKNSAEIFEIFMLLQSHEINSLALSRLKELSKKIGLSNIMDKKEDVFDKICKSPSVLHMWTAIITPMKVLMTKFDCLGFYRRCDPKCEAMSYKDNHSAFIEKLSDILKSEKCRHPFREGALRVSQARDLVKATDRLSNIKVSSNDDSTEYLENINEDVLKGVWWKVKVAIWRQSLISLGRNIFFGIKQCALFVWSGIKSVKNKVVSLVSWYEGIRKDVDCKVQVADNNYVDNFATQINKIRAIDKKDASDKNCPLDVVQPVLDELETDERKLPGFGSL